MEHLDNQFIYRRLNRKTRLILALKDLRFSSNGIIRLLYRTANYLLTKQIKTAWIGDCSRLFPVSKAAAVSIIKKTLLVGAAIVLITVMTPTILKSLLRKLLHLPTTKDIKNQRSLSISRWPTTDRMQTHTLAS